MTTEELDLVEEVLGPVPAKPSRRRSGRSRARTAAKLILAFAIGAFAVLILACAAAFAAINTYTNRVIPGVRVGTVDVSGMSRDEVVARLKTDFAYVGDGKVTITTPSGSATIAYRDAGRTANVEFMADAAMGIGHTGNPFDDAVTMLRTARDGQTIPIAVNVDPMAVATHVAELAGSSRLLPQDAQAAIDFGRFGYKPAVTGQSLDAAAISTAIVDGLARSDAPASFHVGSAFIEFAPQVSDKDARDALAEAQKMSVNVTLTWGGNAQLASPSPSPAKTTHPAKTFAISAMTIQTWISFRTGTDGSYHPVIDHDKLTAYLTALAPGLVTKPVEPSVIFDNSGKPSDVKGGKDGIGLDPEATAQAVEAYLRTLASGGNPGATVAMVTGAVHPKITPTSLAGMQVMGSGSWTTVFYPDVSNGFGANIRTPAKILNGQIVPAGAQFSFLRPSAPSTGRTGTLLAASSKTARAITRAPSAAASARRPRPCSTPRRARDSRSTSGTSITTTSTAIRSGSTPRSTRTATRCGTSSGPTTRPNPIVIRAWATTGSTSRITVQLWSLPLDRKVDFQPGVQGQRRPAGDRTVYVTSLPPGQKNRAEYPTAGFSTPRGRAL